MATKALSIFLLVSLSSFIASIQAQDCNNPLLDTFNLTSLSAPRSAAALPYCTDLRSGQSCCSNATVNALQTALNNLTERLQAAASSRDLLIAQLRDQYLNQFQDIEDNLGDLSDQITNIRGLNATIGNQIISQRDQIDTISEELSDLDDDFQSALRDYQRTRVACFNTVLKVQASAWCLACDPNYASKGVLENGTIIFSGDLCNTISQGCYPFLQASDKQNPLFRARQAFQRLQNLITYIGEFASTGAIPNRTLQGDIATSTNATERTVAIPLGCEAANNCPWQCQNLFSGLGVMDESIVANGAGLIGGADINFGPIGNTNARRVLQNGGAPTIQSVWNPNIEATGFTYDVIADPAGVTGLIGDGSNDLSGLKMKVTGAMVGLFLFIVALY